jgi:Cys-tRNA(Pro)/Cys-tRNA(Cys) deacylase
VFEKSNAMRILDAAGIAYEVRTYIVDEHDLSAETAAEKLGLPPERVFKSLVVKGDRNVVLVALVPAGSVIDLKRLAIASGDKRVEMAPLMEVKTITGYERGAVTPLALPRKIPVLIDETVELWPRVGVSGGVRGVEIVLAPSDLIRVTNATTADIACSA